MAPALRRYCYSEVVPFAAMVMVECSNVGLNTLFKAATLKGMSYYVFIVYSDTIATLLLMPFAFICHRKTELPPFNMSLLYKICLLGFIGFLAQMVGYKGIDYSTPTLASSISNLTPAFTFALAIIFRMEKLKIRSSSSQAKIIGTILSISGAFVVILYKGPAIISTTTASPSISLNQSPIPVSSQSNWAIAGLLLAAEYLLLSVWYIVQAHIIKTYPAELVVVFFYNLCATIISASVCLIAEKNSSAWSVSVGIALAAILYSGLFGTSTGTVVHTWGIRLKGPVYIALFKPLSTAIAAVMGVIFLGDTLYLGSIVGAVIISVGFYVVIWGKAKEENVEDFQISSLESTSTQKVPLLQGYNSDQER
ncbi:hypothetical protein F0562_004972 [Nyssa sinensis]|uniref:WAT1-related protein n=1 Tax=Nyssa sinensis TaxID=561372 RepID=A0A5J5AGX6_9ASTE|nr:hypothetical protein F0562_004972 [Nyssa sinensis]